MNDEPRHLTFPSHLPAVQIGSYYHSTKMGASLRPRLSITPLISLNATDVKHAPGSDEGIVHQLPRRRHRLIRHQQRHLRFHGRVAVVGSLLDVELLDQGPGFTFRQLAMG